ncbi:MULTISPECIES: extracellular solute-binding protein [unclassified Leifsonia]|uniref:extracellular solute-binding protein n=1 Tax=unclassified Leifsonia TaxID=2663824 RepID=UPI0006F6A20E|nr:MULTISPECIES: extracellular solute-binding protein [unclassified Leifsonia]KQX07843.1 sugar ABC transporter substrate-binding protein [Leifsonia sp. Root1293]KRA12124.1 sugar ABC transporter substrate-binding protein [Leifsonia sp. Root60]
MKKSLRVGAVVATAALATVTLASCGFGSGSSGDASGSATTLNLLVPSYSDNTQGLWETVIDGFEKENPDIKVELEVQSWDNLNDVVTTKIQANQAPDIMNGGPFAGFAADDLLYPIEDVVSSDTLADFQDSFVEVSSVGDTQYGAPLIASARALFVNNDLLTQAGVTTPPTTWDELLADAKKVSALGGGVAGYGMPLGSEEAQAESAVWFYGGGGTFGDADEITIDGVPANLEAATFMQKMIDEGATEADAGSTDRSPLMDIFVQGKIGMQVGLPPTVGQIAEGNPDLDYSIVPIPTKDGSPFTLGVADHLMAFKNDGKKQEAITKFLDYYYTPDVYVPWVKTEGFLPTTKSGAEQLSSEADLKPFLDLLPAAQFYPNTNPAWDATNAAFKSTIGKLAQGDDPQAVLAEIQAAADAG